MKTEEEVQANLKIPKSLKEKLKAAAKDNHRSMTAEVVARLEQSFGEVRLRASFDEMPLETLLALFDHLRDQIIRDARNGETEVGEASPPQSVENVSESTEEETDPRSSRDKGP